MSEEAFQIYSIAETEQHSRNEARRILTRVDQARKSPHAAGVRWPFELLQNALDAGPRSGKSTVKVGLRDDGTTMVFEHDGAPFAPNELAALVSGGSSKEYESEETTGRFGTGFLVTHVLAERVRLRGMLAVDSGCEAFELTLDRSGDEDEILTNMGKSRQAIRAAELVSDLDSELSAAIEYAHRGEDVFARGLDELRRALPYVYGTRDNLGCLELQTSDGRFERWTPSSIYKVVIDGGYLEWRKIAVATSNSSRRDLRVYRFAREQKTSAAVLVLVEETSSGLEVRLPGRDAPRVFREYPLRSSGFLPVNLVIDGKFEPEQERGGLLMDSGDRSLIGEALAAGVVSVRYAVEQKWRNAHWLSYASRPDRGFAVENTEETAWWSEALRTFVKGLASAPIVECESQVLPALAEHRPHVDFIVPRLLADANEDETSVERLWPLVAETKNLIPPALELAKDWTSIAEGWRSLGVKVSLVSVEKLADCVRTDAGTLDELGVIGNTKQWLVTFLDVVGECWLSRAGVNLSVLEGMMPNQNLRLCSPSKLKRDLGVSGSLKCICTSIEYDIREQLLLDGLDKAVDQELNHAASALTKAVPEGLNEEDIVAELVNRLDHILPDGKVCNDVDTNMKHATARILAHLWETKKGAAASVAKRLPLLTSSCRSVRWSQNRLLMAPVRAWRESAQQFKRAYPPDRVLSELYTGSSEGGVPDVTLPLVRWGMAYADPIIESTVDLRDSRLQKLSATENTDGLVVPQQRMSQIALLAPEVLNRCQENPDDARALLGLVLCCVAKHDPAWKEQRVVYGRRKGEEVELSICGALWLADLKVRAWVPFPGEDDKPQKVVANAATLMGLLDPTWLQDNGDAIRLLSEWFGFDGLELRLLGIAQDEKDRQKLRNSLADLVDSGGANPQFYKDLARKVVVQKRDVDRCRRLGLAVQDAVATALRRRGLEVTLVDRGFDYEVDLPSDDVYHDARSAFELGPYLVEVKATTTGQARLTPKQAETCAGERNRYVLCVVDLRQMDEVNALDFEGDWISDRVENLAKLVPAIGDQVGDTYRCVELATNLEVCIRNERALRYEVAPDIWEKGLTIDDWVSRVMGTLR